MPNYGKPFAGLCVATAILLCGLTGYPVAPEVLPAPTGSLDMSGTGSGAVISAGGTVTLTGTGFAPGAAVTISVHSQPRLLAEVVADNTGSINAVVQLPADLEPGEHTLSAIGYSVGDGTSLQSDITVVEATELPFTGASVIGWTLAGIGVLLGGFVLLRSVAFGRPFLPR